MKESELLMFSLTRLVGGNKFVAKLRSAKGRTYILAGKLRTFTSEGVHGLLCL
jgi:hypothetical protein